MPNILLGITGSVAAIKTMELATALSEVGEVQIVATKSASWFPNNIADIADDFKIHRDEDEWPQEGFKLGDPVLHIELRRWADILVVAPLSANTLAKISNGLCDNLLTCIARAWDNEKPRVVAPAMNTCMWENYLTEDQIKKIIGLGWGVIDPVEKLLACGDQGMGAMAPTHLIATCVNDCLAEMTSFPKSITSRSAF